MTSKERMKSWEDLADSQNQPAWETWKRILDSKGHDIKKAKEQWEKIAKKKLDR
jgi:hypothetical protein